MQKLLARHGDEAPILRPRGVVEFPDRLHFLVELPHADGADSHALATGGAPRHAFHFSAIHRGGGGPIRQQVLGLAQPHGFQHARIAGRIIGHHDIGAGVETLHQQAAFIIRGGTDGAANHLGAALQQPLARGLHHRAGHFHIVRRFEKPEEPGVFLLKLVVVPVHDSGHPAANLPIPARQKALHFGMRVERVLLGVQQFLLGHA